MTNLTNLIANARNNTATTTTATTTNTNTNTQGATMNLSNLISNARNNTTTTATNTTATNTTTNTQGNTMNLSNLISNARNNTSTNTNTNNPITTNNTTNSGEANMIGAPINESALSSQVAAQIFLLNNNPKQAIVMACALVKAVSLVRTTGLEDQFVDLMLDSLDEASLRTVHIAPSEAKVELQNKIAAAKAQGVYYIPTKAEAEAARTSKGTRTEEVIPVSFDVKEVLSTLGKLKFITRDGKMGDKLVELVEQRKEAYAPVVAGRPWERKFKLLGLEKTQLDKASGLAFESIQAQESSEFTVDEFMRSVANQVMPKLKEIGIEDCEEYVLAGCNAMSADVAYISEFKFDNRLRTYQAACHGPNGQASDRSRALMDLAGVTQDYDVATVRKVIMAEVEDMTKLRGQQLAKAIAYANENPVESIVRLEQQLKSQRAIQKPWSFVKAARILTELDAGNKPYIGMAVGLDAKCSGPQYGALMAGDVDLAAACGFSEKKVADAYERCIQVLSNAFPGLTRSGVKTAFMGVFYGQGWAAFMDVAALRKNDQDELADALLGGESYISEARAKLFHSLVTKSLGKKLGYIREQILKFNTEGRFTHYMPDGARVQMNYKMKQNIWGEIIELDTICPDVYVTINGTETKFIKMALKTKDIDAQNFVRTAFVNMIQAVDALIARLIIVHLKRMGAQHIVAVHDCFRVNVTEMHLLEAAIKQAYLDVFGSKFNTATKDLPMGTDILGMFFQGLEDVRVDMGDEDEKPDTVSQYLNGKRVKTRILQIINGKTVEDHIKDLGVSYYFAK